MQDFTKNQHFNPISEQPKKGFIKSRLNKDNFWNLIFAFGIISIWIIIDRMEPQKTPTVGFLLSWFSILGIPLIVKYFARVKFIDGKFFNSQGQKLDIPKQVPNIFCVIFLPIILAALAGAIADGLAGSYPNKLIDLVFGPIFFICIFFTPVVFFIIKNCPITILFNYQFYKQNIQPITSSAYDRKSPNSKDIKPSSLNQKSYTTSSSDSHSRYWQTDPAQYYRPNNTHNRR